MVIYRAPLWKNVSFPVSPVPLVTWIQTTFLCHSSSHQFLLSNTYTSNSGLYLLFYEDKYAILYSSFYNQFIEWVSYIALFSHHCLKYALLCLPFPFQDDILG